MVRVATAAFWTMSAVAQEPQADAAALIENTFTDMSEMGATGAGRE